MEGDLRRRRTRTNVTRQLAGREVQDREEKVLTGDPASAHRDENLTQLLNSLAEKRASEQGENPDDVEGDVRDVEDVIAWINSIGYPEYADRFRENQVDGPTLKTITSSELRADLNIRNPKHRNEILRALDKLVMRTALVKSDPLPQAGKVLSLLSNLRTYHSWTLVGIQLYAFSIALLRLGPRSYLLPLVGVSAFYCGVMALCILVFGNYSYRRVVRILNKSVQNARLLKPNRRAVFALTFVELVACVLVIVAIILTITEG